MARMRMRKSVAASPLVLSELIGSIKLCDLPTELIGAICEHLDSHSFTRLRLTCRQLEEQSSFTFRTQIFDCVVAILNHTSLKILSDIAQHPVFRNYITTVVISSENEWGITATHHWRNYADKLWSTLLELPNLQHVRFDSKSYGESTSRYPGIRCGYTELQRKFQGYSVDRVAHMRDVKDALTSVLYAFHGSGIQNTTTLDIDLDIPHANTTVNTNWLDAPGVLEALRNGVEKLSFDVESLFASTVLIHLHSLKVLSISGIKEQNKDHNNNLTGLADVFFPSLARLELRDSKLEHAKLVKSLTTHKKTLSSIFLKELVLYGERTESKTDWAWSDPIAAMKSMPLLSTLTLEASHYRYCELPYPCVCQGGARKAKYVVLKCNGRNAVVFSLGAISKGLALLSSSRTFPKSTGMEYVLDKASDAGISGISLYGYGETQQSVPTRSPRKKRPSKKRLSRRRSFW